MRCWGLAQQGTRQAAGQLLVFLSTREPRPVVEGVLSLLVIILVRSAVPSWSVVLQCTDQCYGVHMQGVPLARRFALVPLGPPLLSYSSTAKVRRVLSFFSGLVRGGG